MPFIKFSQFTTTTNPASIDFLVGYEGTTMKKIDPANIGGGATDLNGLTDCLVDNASLYVGEVPGGLAGNPQGNTVLGINAGNDINSGANNTLIGNNAGEKITLGAGNIVVGQNALALLNTSFTIAIGESAGYSASGYNSSYIGYQAGRVNTASGHISIGYRAGYSNTSGASNTNIGYKAGYGVTTGGQNTLIGYEAGMDSSLVASGVVALGYQAGKEFEAGDGAVLVGRHAGAANGSTKQQTVFIGDGAGRYISSAFNTAVGAGALRGGTTSGSSAGYNTAVGTLSLKLITTGDNNVAIGANAGDALTTGSNNIIIGKDSDASSATVSNEITLGNAAVTSLRIPGLQSGASNGDVLTYNASAGKLELQAGGGGGASSLNGLSDVSIQNSGTSISSYFVNIPSGLSGTPIDNLTIQGGTNLTTGHSNTILGDSETGKRITTGTFNTIIGARAGADGANFTDSVVVGYGAKFASTGNNAVVIGVNAGTDNVTTNAVVIGKSAGSQSAENIVAIGYQAFAFGSGASKTNSVAIGKEAGRSTTSAGHISIGYEAGYSNTSGLGNTNVGYQAGYSNTTAADRTIIGYEAGEFSTGAANTFLGLAAGKGSSGSSTGSYNTAMGKEAGLSLTSGGQNVLIGSSAGDSITSGNNNIVIGYEADTSAGNVSNTITLGGASNNLLRIPGLGSTDGHVLTYEAASGGIVLKAAGGGGGASSLNGLSDCLVDTASLYVGEVPSSLSGNPQGNTTLGSDAGRDLTSGGNNTIIGNYAGLTATTSADNVLIGLAAGQAVTNTGKQKNICIGNNTFQTVAGTESVVVGFEAGRISTTSQSAYVGYQAGWANSGNSNASLGYQALFGGGGALSVGVGRDSGKNNTSTGHVSVGYRAGYSQTSGSANTNLGYQAGYSNTTNGENVNVGYNAGKTATGSQNVAVGRNAFGDGFGHSGIGNVVMGYSALSSPSGASSYNVAIGSEALKGSGTKSNNIAVGYQAGAAVTTGGNNTILGYKAGKNITTGLQNVVIGAEASEVGTGIINYNVTIGYRANENSGSAHNYDSVAIGQGAGQNTAAEGNVIIGYNAQEPSLTGGFNTIIGKQAKVGSTGSTGTNNLVLGYQAQSSASNVSNEITLGNSNITSLRCAVTSITSLSDERDKTNIKDLGYGLAFIDALQPREFVWDNRPETKLVKDIENDTETEVEFYSANKGKKDFGFIAQEVKELDNDTLRLVYDENPDKLELSYGKLVPILVQAIKELKEEVELLKSQNK